jgi:hypothetical protein
MQANWPIPTSETASDEAAKALPSFRNPARAIIPYRPGGGASLSGQPHLGDEVGQVLQRVVEVARLERRELEVLAHLRRDG